MERARWMKLLRLRVSFLPASLLEALRAIAFGRQSPPSLRNTCRHRFIDQYCEKHRFLTAVALARFSVFSSPWPIESSIEPTYLGIMFNAMILYDTKHAAMIGHDMLHVFFDICTTVRSLVFCWTPVLAGEANETVASRCSSLACAKAAMPRYITTWKTFTPSGEMGITWNLTNKGTQAMSRHHAVSNTWQGSLIQHLNHIRKVKQLIQSIHVNSISRLSVSFCQGSSQQIQNPDIVRLIAIVPFYACARFFSVTLATSVTGAKVSPVNMAISDRSASARSAVLSLRWINSWALMGSNEWAVQNDAKSIQKVHSRSAGKGIKQPARSKKVVSLPWFHDA